jgi:hypothetical protein
LHCYVKFKAKPNGTFFTSLPPLARTLIPLLSHNEHNCKQVASFLRCQGLAHLLDP